MSVSEHRTHGLADDLVVPDWPPLEDAEIERLLARYPDQRGPFAIAWRSPRPLSAAARVQTASGEVFVKRHPASVRSPQTLATEHALVAHLRRGGIPIPRVLADQAGHTAVGCTEWTYEVHAPARGLDLFRDAPSWAPLDDPAQARTAGAMLAHVHRAAASFEAPVRDTFLLVSRDDLLRAPNLLDALEDQLPRRPALAAYLRQHDWHHDLAPIAARVREIQPHLADQPRLWTHNDWHGSNLFWSDAGSDARITAVLDFGLTAPTFALYDLATAIERNAVSWLHLGHGMHAIFPDTARGLIAGYRRVQPLDAGDCALLAELLPVVHIEFALSELEYFHGITHSREDADAAYYTFLLGHAAWFDTPPGRALLDAIRTGA
jgi:Ser/Thr protein kinase RdoA (MazF antagonist)